MSGSDTDDGTAEHGTPLSSVQEWIHDQSVHAVGPPQVIRVEVPVPPHRGDDEVVMAVIAVGRVHEALRTRVVPTAGGLMQLVDPVDDGWSTSVRQALRRVRADVPPFESVDLSRGALRTSVYRAGDGQRRLVVDLDHMVCDDWGASVLRGALADAVAGRPLSLVERQPRYYGMRDRDGRREQAALAATHRRIAGAPLATTFVPRRVESGVGWGDRPYAVHTDEPTGAKLRRFAEEHRVSTFAAWLAVMSAVVQRYTTVSDQVVKTFVHNRGPGDEQVVASLVGELWLRIRGDGADDIRQRVHAAMSGLLLALRDRACAGHLLRDELNSRAAALGLSVRRPAFLCHWRPPVDLGLGSAEPAERIEEERHPTSSRVPEHDLMCTGAVVAGQLHLYLILGQGLWPYRSPKAVCADLLRTLDFMAANPDACVVDVPVSPLPVPSLPIDRLTGVHVSTELAVEVLSTLPGVTSVRLDIGTSDRHVARVEVCGPLTVESACDFHAAAVARAARFRGVVVPDLVLHAPGAAPVRVTRQESGEPPLVTSLDESGQSGHHQSPATTEHRP